MLAGLTLLVATLYLKQRGRNPFYTGIPMVFMLISTFTALIQNLIGFWQKQQTLLFVVDIALLMIGIGIVIEGLRAFLSQKRYDTDEIEFARE